MIIKAFNQEFDVSINVPVSQITTKIIQLIESKVDFLKEFNDFVATVYAEYEKVRNVAYAECEKVNSAVCVEYEKVRSAAYAEYQQKLISKLNELLSRI